MKAIIGGAVLFLCLLPAYASAGDYYLVAAPKNNAYIEFIDAGTLKYPEPNMPKVWVTTVPSHNNPSFSNIDYSMRLTSYDCINERIKTLNTVVYAIGGSVLSSQAAPTYTPMDVVVPDSVASAELEFVCKPERGQDGHLGSADDIGMVGRRILKSIEPATPPPPTPPKGRVR